MAYHRFMSAIAVKEVTRQFGTQVVLERVSFDLREGEIAGLVGANGSGKTTLFRILAGEIQPDTGTVTRSRGLEIGHLKQEPEAVPDRTLHDEVASVFDDLLAMETRLHTIAEKMSACGDGPALCALMDEYERVNGRFLAAGGHGFQTRLNEILGGLGFAPSDYDKPMVQLSGGQKCRAALAKLLLAQRRFLLLDEPTNHLDIDAVRWLERFLSGHPGGAVIISHDRYLLDRLCCRILEMEDQRISCYPGNYTNYHETKQRRLLTQERQFEKDTEFIRKERDFIDRHHAAQRSKQAQGRRTRLQRGLRDGEFVTEQTRRARRTRMAFAEVAERTGTMLRCDDLGMAFGPHRLFEGLTLIVQPGDRLGITGPNGTGKTTLLKIILKQIAPAAGTCTFDPGLVIGYYGQEHAELDPARSVLEEIRSFRKDFSELAARSYLARFLFRGDDVFKTLGLLSGGEQSRVRLACLMLGEPELLILDEPTNHLDIPSCEVLEETLTSFGGTMILVSHDRYFLDSVVNRLLVLRRDGHAVFPGNYSEYAAQVEADESAARVKATRDQARSRRRAPVPARKASKASPYDRLSIEELEAMVVEREVKLAELQERYGNPSLYKDPVALEELAEEIESLSAELAEVDAAWQERAASQ